MKTTAYVNSFAALTDSGILSPAGLQRWEEDQEGPADIRRAQVLDRPYPAFGRLSLSDRLAFSAASILFAHAGDWNADTTGICAGVPFGSLSTDARYMESVVQGFPSPALFSATLPSSPVTEVAIYYKIKGPNRTWAHGGSAGVCALDSAVRLLELGKAKHALVMYLNALEARDQPLPFAAEGGPAHTLAYALLLSAGGEKRGTRLGMEQSDVGTQTSPDADQACYSQLFAALVEQTNTKVEIDTAEYCGCVSIARNG